MIGSRGAGRPHTLGLLRSRGAALRNARATQTSRAAARRLALTLLTAPLLQACTEAPTGRVIVTSGFTDQVFVLEAATGDILDSLSVDRRPGERDEPHGIAASPDGRHFYVTLSHGEPSLWKYETAGLRLVGRVALPTNGASRVRLSPDGHVAAVPDYWLSGGGATSRVAFVRTLDLSVIASPEVCPAPHDAAFSPNGALVAVSCAAGDQLVILDAETFTDFQRHSLDPGAKPMNVAWHGDESVLLTLGGQPNVVDFDLNTPGSRSLLTTEEGGAQIAVGRDRAVVANHGAGTVSIVDLLRGGTQSVTMPGPNPHGVALSPGGSIAYVTYEGDSRSRGGVVAIEIASGEILWHTAVGVFTLGVAVIPG
ncbi:MAG: WD40 repeat domain-containing protein [Gemmatimonadetes bacterium]|nr:WD40 repeat domain-containing protein [Gemmatimonadota bacterium]